MRSLPRSPVLANPGVILIPPELEDDPDLVRAMCAAIDRVHDAMTRPLTTEEIEPFMYRPEPPPLPEPYEPTPQDWDEYRAVFDAQDLDAHAWSVYDHHMALQVFLTFFPE